MDKDTEEYLSQILAVVKDILAKQSLILADLNGIQKKLERTDYTIRPGEPH